MARKRAAILLEIILALAMFTVIATILLTAIRQTAEQAVRIQLRTRAADLAFTLVSELQTGQLPLQATDSRPYEDPRLADWQWQIELADPPGAPLTDGPIMRQAIVTVSHVNPSYQFSLGQLVPDTSQDAETP